MFAVKSTVFLAFCALSASLAASASTPPACLLAAVNEQPNPSDLATICGTKATEVKADLKSKCDDNYKVALTYFESVCGDTSSNSTSTATGSSSSSTASTGFGSGSTNGTTTNGTATYTAGTVTPTASGTGSGSSSGSGTGSSGSSTTSSASSGQSASSNGASGPQNNLGSLAAAAIALAGVVAVL